MKFNWGWGLAIALVLFAIFIGQFLFRAMGDRADLVADDYYNQEINYQDRIDNAARAKALGAISFVPIDDKIGIAFPAGFNGAIATGTVHLYKPDNSDFDQSFPLAIDSSNVHIFAAKDLIRGLWRIKIEAKASGESYYWEESINL